MTSLEITTYAKPYKWGGYVITVFVDGETMEYIIPAGILQKQVMGWATSHLLFGDAKVWMATEQLVTLNEADQSRLAMMVWQSRAQIIPGDLDDERLQWALGLFDEVVLHA